MLWRPPEGRPNIFNNWIFSSLLEEAVQPMIVLRRAPVRHASWIVQEHFSGGALL
jgi:hypothetical protein